MGFVEPVAGELGHQVEDLFGLVGVDALFFCTVQKDLALLFHDLFFLLAHRPAQKIGAAQRVSGHDLSGLHDLLLIDHHAEGRLQDVLEPGVRVFDLLSAVFSVDVVVDHAAAQRPRPVQGHRRDDVLELTWLEPLENPLEAFGFKLEHPRGVARGDQVVGPLVIERNVVGPQCRFVGAALLVDQLNRRVDDRQGLESQEIEFDQPGLLDLLHGELGDHLALVAAFDGHTFPDGVVGDDDPGGVNTGLTVQILDRQRDIEERIDPVVLPSKLPEFWLFGQRLVQ